MKIVSGVNEVVFAPENYESEEDMWKAISTFLRIIFNEGHIAKIKPEEDFIVIQFAWDDEFSEIGLEWIGPDEYIEKVGVKNAS